MRAKLPSSNAGARRSAHPLEVTNHCATRAGKFTARDSSLRSRGALRVAVYQVDRTGFSRSEALLERALEINRKSSRGHRCPVFQLAV